METEREVARKHKEALSSLLESEGWAILVRIVEENVLARTNQVVLLPVGEDFTIYQQEFMKGEVTAYRTLLALPAAKVEEAGAILEATFAPEEE